MEYYGEGTRPGNKLQINVQKMTARLLKAGVLSNIILISDIEKFMRDLYGIIQKERKNSCSLEGILGSSIISQVFLYLMSAFMLLSQAQTSKR